MEARETNLLLSLTRTTWRFYAWVGLLGAVLLWGLYAYILQLRQGLIVTGMRDQISWGLYITNFVFFIGISHAGTLISAILRVTDTGWRRPITRMAEAITVFALCIGAPMVMIDMGRPDRMLNLFRYGRIQSPIIWDVLGVSTYLTGCVLYFYLPMIPDVAFLAEQPQVAGWRRRLYRTLSLGWTGSAEQKRLLEKAISVMAVFIIPLAVSVHTVVSWIFAMTLRPGWDSSIFGPYFVIGAIYSGAAGVIFSMWVLRRVFHLEDYVKPLHFRNLGLLLLAFSMLYLYFNINEYLTSGYKLEGMDRVLLDRLFLGDYAGLFWSAQSLCVFLPLLIMLAVLGLKRYQQFTIPGVVLASLLVVVGAWLKRYIIVVPTLRSPFLPSGQRLPWEWTHYRPTWVEWSITAAALAGFLLIYTLLAKLFPIVSIWETREDEATGTAAAEGVAPVRWWRAGGVAATMLLLGLLVGGAVPARAAARKPKPPQPTSLEVQWAVLPPTATTTGDHGDSEATAIPHDRVYWYSGRIFDPFAILHSPPTEKEAPAPGVTVVAILRDASGAPLGFKPLEFFLQTGFGKLPFGTRPTLADGKARLTLHDRRYGKYPVEVTFAGDEQFAASRFTVPVDFGPRPEPTLPQAGMLITPYATPAIAFPFLLFYGAMWLAFVYAFGYLVLWRMRRASASTSAPEQAPNPRTWRGIRASRFPLAILVIGLLLLGAAGGPGFHASAGPSPADSATDVSPVSGPCWLKHLGVKLADTRMGQMGGDSVIPATSRQEPAVTGAGAPQPFRLTGADLYRFNCRSCHGPDGKGAPPGINSLLGPTEGATAELILKRAEARGIDMDQDMAQQMAAEAEAAIRKQIVSGGEKMPAFVHLRPQEVDAILAYLRQLAGASAPNPAPSTVTASADHVGEQIVKGTCHICHDATGPKGIVSSLERLPKKSLDDVMQQVQKGSSSMTAEGEIDMPALPYFTRDEIAAAYFYLFKQPPRP